MFLGIISPGVEVFLLRSAGGKPFSFGTIFNARVSALFE